MGDIRYGFTVLVPFLRHAGYFAAFMIFCALMSFTKYTLQKRKIDLIYFLVFILGIVISTRRKPLIGLILSLIIFFIVVPSSTLRFKFRKLSIIGTLIAIITFLFFDLINDVLQSGYTYFYQLDNLDIARNALYVIAITISSQYFPLGLGFAQFGGATSFINYSNAYYEYGLNRVYGLGPGIDESMFGMDTYWPYLIGQIGLLGLIIFLYMLWKLFLFLKSKIRSELFYIKFLSISSVCILVEAIWEAFTSPVFSNTFYIYFIFVPIGFLMSFEKNISKNRLYDYTKIHLK